MSRTVNVYVAQALHGNGAPADRGVAYPILSEARAQARSLAELGSVAVVASVTYSGLSDAKRTALALNANPSIDDGVWLEAWRPRPGTERRVGVVTMYDTERGWSLEADGPISEIAEILP